MNITCAACGFENDPTRVYCHSCGQKLERGESSASALPGGFTPPPPAEAARARRRGPSRPWGSYFYALVKFAILVAVAAMVWVAFLRPDNVPAPVDADDARAAALTASFERAADSPGTAAFKFSAPDVNKWFVSSAHFKAAQNSVALRPVRVYAVPGEGVIRVGIETELPAGELRLFFEGEYMPVREDGAYVLRPVRYSVGRLILPVYLGWPVERQLGGLALALSQPLELFARASEIKVAPEAVTLRWSGGGAR